METNNNPNPESRRDSFIFYRSFWEAIREADEAGQRQLYAAIAAFALDGEEPQLTGLIKAVWLAIKPQLEANRKRYENGKKGGAPKGSSNNPTGRRGKAIATEPKEPITNQELTKNKANNNVNVNENENVNVESKTKKRSVFSPPSLDEVRDFFSKGNFTSDPAAFFDHYEANGWVQRGGKPIKNWQAAARQWERRQAEFAPRHAIEPATKAERRTEFATHIIAKLNNAAPRNVNDQWDDFEMPTK